MIAGAQALSSAFFGEGTGSIFLDDVACTGSELTLLECPTDPIGSHNCGHYEDAGVHCPCTYKKATHTRDLKISYLDSLAPIAIHVSCFILRS